jgi:23S rRNA (cytidine2498-2'-O)-methyltransferase
VRAERGSGYVVYAGVDGAETSRALPWRDLIFARQKLVLLAQLRALDPRDRVTPILRALHEATPSGTTPFGDLHVEHPDSDACKPLA